MAKVTIETHNVTVNQGSGRTTFNISYESCTGISATIMQGSTLTNILASLNASGNLVLQWNPNTSTVGIGCVIEVKAQDGNGNYVYDRLAFNQKGTNINPTFTGQFDIEGDSAATTYSLYVNAMGRWTVTSPDSWISIQSVVKTYVTDGNASVAFSRNTGEPRCGYIKFACELSTAPYETTCFKVITQGAYVSSTSELYYAPNTANVGFTAGTHTSIAPVKANVSSLTVRNVSGDMDIQSVDLDSNGALIIVYGANEGRDNKSATITVRGLGNNGYISASYTLYQGAYTYVVSPIWKTTPVEVQGEPYVDYTITTEGAVIYSGRAYQLPGEDLISFELNEVVRDYVDNTLWWRPGYQTPSGWERTFTLEMSNGGTGDYIFTKDWSYIERGYEENDFICINEPIINELPAGCYAPICAFSPQRAGNFSFRENGSQVYLANLDNARQARYLFPVEAGSEYGWRASSTNYNYHVYKGVAPCNYRYVLYYENAYGGIDAMPIKGIATATDKITAYTTKNGVRVPSTSFSYRRYLNEVAKTWEFKTGYLSDLQASRMHHLLESTMVYVYDMYEDKLIPAVIDETTVTYKTYKNQGRKFFNYSFKVQESQRKIRK